MLVIGKSIVARVRAIPAGQAILAFLLSRSALPSPLRLVMAAGETEGGAPMAKGPCVELCATPSSESFATARTR